MAGFSVGYDRLGRIRDALSCRDFLFFTILAAKVVLPFVVIAEALRPLAHFAVPASMFTTHFSGRIGWIHRFTIYFWLWAAPAVIEDGTFGCLFVWHRTEWAR
jgi:hypothetical protein